MNVSSESLFQKIFEVFSEPIVVVKADAPRFTIVACNHLYKTVSRTAHRNLIGTAMKEVYADVSEQTESDDLIQAALLKAIDNKKLVKLEEVRYDIPGKDNKEVKQTWWQAEYMPLFDDAGKVEYLVCTTRNITSEVLGREAEKKSRQQQAALEKEKALTEELTATNKELNESRRKIEALNNELEEKVADRTKALAISEENFRSIIVQSPVAMGLFTGREMTLQVINDAFLELWGRGREIVGKPLLEALPEMKDQPYYGIMQKVLATGDTYYGNEEMVILFRNGRMEEGYYNFINHPFKDAEGNNVGIIVVAMDVTAQVRTHQSQQLLNEQMAVINEELTFANGELITTNEDLSNARSHLEEVIAELGESEERLIRFFMQAPAGVCILDGPELVFELVNPHYQLLFPGRDLLGKTLLEAMPEVKDQPILNILQDVYTTGKTFEGKDLLIRLAYNDGEPVEDRYFNFIYQPRLDAKGKVDGILVFVFEVTGAVIARKKIEQAEETLRFAVEAANIGTWYLDIHKRELSASPRMKELYGYEEGDTMTFETTMSQIPEEHKKIVSLAIEHAMANGSTYNIEHPVIGYHDGQVRWVKILGSMHTDSNGNYAHLSGVVIDITEQKKDEIRKNDFIAMVSHELKTPLTTLKAYTQLIATKATDKEDDFTINALDKANRQLNKMTSMINSFLNVARLEAGKIDLQKTVFDLENLIGETISEVIVMMQYTKIEFLPCKPLPIYADAEKIAQVVNNLLTNAIKYSPVLKPVQVACREVDGMAVVSVTDEGIGIGPEHIDKLFDRFYRVESGTNRTVAGFGIGLYLSAEIVHRHNGRIWVESEEGKGSTFYFSVPLTIATEGMMYRSTAN